MKSAVLVIVVSALISSVMATETPAYKILSQGGSFEVRDYPALTLVRTATRDGDFMQLFRHISQWRKPFT